MLNRFFKSVLDESARFFENIATADIIYLAIAGVLILSFFIVMLTLLAKNSRLSADSLQCRMQNNRITLKAFGVSGRILITFSGAAAILETLSRFRGFERTKTLLFFHLSLFILFGLLNLILHGVCKGVNKKITALKRINDALKGANLAKSAKSLEERLVSARPVNSGYPEPKTDIFAPVPVSPPEPVQTVITEILPANEEDKEQFDKIKGLLKKICALPLSLADEINVKKFSLILDEERYNIDNNLPAEKSRLNESLSGLLKIMAKYSV